MLRTTGSLPYLSTTDYSSKKLTDMLICPILISDPLGSVKAPRMINEIVSDKASNYLLYSKEGLPPEGQLYKTEG